MKYHRINNIYGLILLIYSEKKIFGASFLGSFILALCAFLFNLNISTEKNKEIYDLSFESVYSLGVLGLNREFGYANYIETPDTVLYKIRNLHIPNFTATLEKKERVSIKVTATNPNNTNLIVLFSEGNETLKPHILRLHTSIFERVYANQLKIYESLKFLKPTSSIEVIGLEYHNKSPKKLSSIKSLFFTSLSILTFSIVFGILIVFIANFLRILKLKLRIANKQYK